MAQFQKTSWGKIRSVYRGGNRRRRASLERTKKRGSETFARTYFISRAIRKCERCFGGHIPATAVYKYIYQVPGSFVSVFILKWSLRFLIGVVHEHTWWSPFSAGMPSTGTAEDSADIGTVEDSADIGTTVVQRVLGVPSDFTGTVRAMGTIEPAL